MTHKNENLKGEKNTMKKLAKLFSLLLVFAMAFSLFAACGNSEEATTEETKTETEEKTEEKTEETTEPAEVKDGIVIATANEPPTLHPYLHSAVAASYMNYLTYDNFLRSNVETMEPEAGAITAWEAVSDKEWHFTIRDDMTYHNGEKVLAEDFVATMYFARENESYTSSYSAFFESAEVIDDTHFKVITKDVYAKTLYDMASFRAILDKDLIEAGHDFNADPIGTGPYIFKNWELGDHLDFVANENYWDGAPAITNMTWRIIPEGSSRTIALEAEEIDMIIEVETNDLARLEESDKIAITNIPGTSFNWLILNNEVAPFDNQDFRHFMNCAIQKDALVMVALNGAGTPNYRQSPGMFAGATDENMDEYNPELAKQYLEKSGIDPTTVVFSTICSDDVKRRCGEVMQATLAEYGITMNIESMDLATYLSAAAEGNFQATIGGATTSNAIGFVDYKYHSKMIGGSNWTRTNDPKIDALYDEAVQTLDETKRMELVEECIAYIQEICPQVPTYSMNMVRAMDADLEGFEMNASGNTYWHYVSWAE